ncbi:MAG: HU family DNA-binding protein [Phycisphaerales bacterium JB060]
MNKSHLVDHVAASLGVTRSDATVYLDTVLDGITKGLIEDGRVKLTGFGAFTRRHRSARNGTNPLSGEPIVIPASETCRFKASPALREHLNNASRPAGQIEHKRPARADAPHR